MELIASSPTRSSLLRTRWAAVGAAVAVTLGAGTIGYVSATSPSDAATFVPITPCRVFDTRPEFQVGPRSSPLVANETYTVDGTGVTGDCTISTDATGLVLNVTAVRATAPTFITVWGDGDQPNASSLNPTPGLPPTPNAVTTDLTDTDGEFHVYNLAGTVHLLADAVGYYTDHHHDERYYTESEIDASLIGPHVLTIAPAEFQPRRSATYGHADPPGGGITLVEVLGSAFSSEFFDTGVSLPVGTTIEKIDVFVDPNGIGTGALFEYKDPLGADEKILATATSTTGSDRETVELDVDHVIEQGRVYRLVVELEELETNALYGAEVTYTLPAP